MLLRCYAISLLSCVTILTQKFPPIPISQIHHESPKPNQRRKIIIDLSALDISYKKRLNMPDVAVEISHLNWLLQIKV